VTAKSPSPPGLLVTIVTYIIRGRHANSSTAGTGYVQNFRFLQVAVDPGHPACYIEGVPDAA
jgi:hypothetical protein